MLLAMTAMKLEVSPKHVRSSLSRGLHLPAMYTGNAPVTSACTL